MSKKLGSFVLLALCLCNIIAASTGVRPPTPSYRPNTHSNHHQSHPHTTHQTQHRPVHTHHATPHQKPHTPVSHHVTPHHNLRHNQPHSHTHTQPNHHQQSHLHTQPHHHPHTQPNHHPHTQPNHHPHTQPNHHPHTQPNHHPHTHPNDHTHTHTHPHPHTQPNDHTHTHPHPNTHTPPQTHNPPHTNPNTKPHPTQPTEVAHTRNSQPNYPQFSQGDPRWKGQNLGASSTSIGSAGCLMTSVTSMVAGRGGKINGASPDPATMNQWLKNNHGFSGDNFVWDSLRPLGLKFDGKVNGKDQISGALNSGKGVILNVNNGGHYVLATGVTPTGYTVMDPGYPRKEYSFNEVVTAGIYSQ